ncbi:MAG TPA: rhomboid family intramembrane serine protease [Chloroflexota bacterium]|nr:rhomboid family intramembrane serine protease [Chloroflexota bacterium]
MIPIRDHNPTRTFPVFTILIMVVNILVFVYELLLQLGSQQAVEVFYAEYGFIPCLITSTCPAGLVRELTALHDPVSPLASLFTAMFVHGGWLHIAGNMLFFWIFGNNVEDDMGHFRFLIFYFVCGLIAAFAQIAFDPTSAVPSLGASGAIAGVLGAYFVTYPTAPVDTAIFVIFIFFVRLPAFVVLGVWIALQFFTGVGELGTHDTGGVATFAHIGGFVAGMLLVFLFRQRRKGPPLPYPV